MLGFYPISGAPISGLSGGKVAYTLTCAAGSYAVTGQTATLTYTSHGSIAYSLSCAAGSYSVTGQAATLHVSHKLTAAAGSYSVTGIAATLKVSHRLTAVKGAYSVTGYPATLTYVSKTPVAYALTCDAGSYVVSGFPAGLTYAIGVETGDTHDGGWKVLKDKPRKWKNEREAIKTAILRAMDGPEADAVLESISEYVAPVSAKKTTVSQRIDWNAVYQQSEQIHAQIEAIKLRIIQEQEDDDEEALLMLL